MNWNNLLSECSESCRLRVGFTYRL